MKKRNIFRPEENKKIYKKLSDITEMLDKKIRERLLQAATTDIMNNTLENLFDADTLYFQMNLTELNKVWDEITKELFKEIK